MGCSNFALIDDGSLEVFRPNARLHKPCKTIGDPQKNDIKTLDCQTLQSDRELTKLPMIVAANNKFRRHLVYIDIVASDIDAIFTEHAI